MPSAIELDKRRQRSLAVFTNRVNQVGKYLENPQELKNELADLLMNMAVCWHDETFYQAQIRLIETVTHAPIRYSMIHQWDAVLREALEHIAPNDVSRLSLVYRLRAQIAYERVHRHQAYEWAMHALQYANESHNPDLIAEASKTVCNILIGHFGKYQQAIDVMEQTERAINALQAPFPYTSYTIWAVALRLQGKIKQGRMIIETMADTWLKPDAPLHEQALLQHQLGLIRWADGAYASAAPELTASAQNYESLHELATACGVYGDLGLCYWSWGKLREAEAVYAQAFRLAKESGDVQREMKLNGNLGLVYLSQGRLDLASVYIDEHIKRARELGSEREYKRACGNWAQLRLYRNQPTKCLDYLHTSISAYKYPSEGRGNDEVLISLCHHMLGDTQKARQHLDNVWQICKDGEHSILPILAYRMAAELYPDQAVTYLSDGLRLAREHDRRLDIAGCLLKLAKICDNVAYYNEAHALLTQMNALDWLKQDKAPLLPLIM